MANGTQSVTYSYDQLNRPTKYTDALGKSETYTYNSYGDMVKKVDRNGITTNYTYDALHRLTKESAAKDGTTTANSYTYALTGQLVSESNGSIAKNYRYLDDGSGKICTDEYIDLNGLTYSTRRLYNAADMLIDITTNRSDVSYSIYNKDYSYDSKGRLYMLSNQSASESNSKSEYNAYYSYDKNDNITQVKVNKGLTSTYSYNDANLLVIYCIFFNHKLKTYAISLLLSLGVLICVVICSVVSYCFYLDFSTESWQRDKRERCIMFGDLKDNYNVVGMNKNEVVQLLGPYDEIIDNENTIYIYKFDDGYVAVTFEIDIVKDLRISNIPYE